MVRTSSFFSYASANKLSIKPRLATGRTLLYAMRVVSNGAFNLCPSEACNPEPGGESYCLIPEQLSATPVEFFPCAGVPAAAVAIGEKIMARGGLDVGGIEYLEAADGRLIF